MRTASTSAQPSLQAQDRSANRFDFLRLVAAWLVLFSHCYPLAGRQQEEPLLSSAFGIDTLGGLGVSIFFVLSGYLVTLSWERSRGLWDFLQRRVLRIYPALLVTCLLCVFFLGPWLTTLSPTEYWMQAKTWGYFKTATAFQINYGLPGLFVANPLPHVVNGSLWSIAYEVRFYVFLMLLGVLPGAMRHKSLLLLAVLGGLLLLRPPVPPAATDELFLGLDFYDNKLGILFCMGAVFAAWRHRVRPGGWAALILLAAAALPLGSLQLLLFVTGFGMFVLWLGFHGRWLPQLPARMGDWSYGLYLYAFPVQQTLAHFRLHEYSFVLYVLCTSVLTFGLAALSWHGVEKHALRWKASGGLFGWGVRETELR